MTAPIGGGIDERLLTCGPLAHLGRLNHPDVDGKNWLWVTQWLASCRQRNRRCPLQHVAGHVLDLGIDYLLVELELLHDFQPFPGSSTFDGPACLQLRYCSSSVIRLDTDLGPEHGPKEKRASANADGHVGFAGARDWNLILCSLRHKAVQ